MRFKPLEYWGSADCSARWRQTCPYQSSCLSCPCLSIHKDLVRPSSGWSRCYGRQHPNFDHYTCHLCFLLNSKKASLETFFSLSKANAGEPTVAGAGRCGSLGADVCDLSLLAQKESGLTAAKAVSSVCMRLASRLHCPSSADPDFSPPVWTCWESLKSESDFCWLLLRHHPLRLRQTCREHVSHGRECSSSSCVVAAKRGKPKCYSWGCPCRPSLSTCETNEVFCHGWIWASALFQNPMFQI